MFALLITSLQSGIVWVRVTPHNLYEGVARSHFGHHVARGLDQRLLNLSSLTEFEVRLRIRRPRCAPKLRPMQFDERHCSSGLTPPGHPEVSGCMGIPELQRA